MDTFKSAADMNDLEVLATVIDMVDTRRSHDEAFGMLGALLDADVEATAHLLLATARVLFTYATTDLPRPRAGTEEFLLGVMRAGAARGYDLIEP